MKTASGCCSLPAPAVSTIFQAHRRLLHSSGCDSDTQHDGPGLNSPLELPANPVRPLGSNPTLPVAVDSVQVESVPRCDSLSWQLGRAT